MDAGPPSRDLLAEGIRLFNDGYFFEAHEIWEEAWHLERGEPRLFLQGLIQVAAGYHHHQSGNPRGAIALFRKARAKFQGYPSPYLGIDTDALLNKVREAERQLERGGVGGDAVSIPRPTIPLPDHDRD